MAKNMTQRQLDNIAPHKFKKGQSGNPKGRPKNRITELLGKIVPKKKMRELKQDLTRTEIDTIERKVLQLELSDLQLLAKADQPPAYLKALAMAIIIDMKNGKTATVDKLRDRQYGAVQQKHDVKGDGNSFLGVLMHSRMIEANEDELQ